MSDVDQTNSPTATSKVVDATSILDSLKFRTGVSAKTGNPYVMGTVYIKTRSGKPYGLDLKFIDENGQVMLEDALQNSNEETRQGFAQGLK